jgi:hypothetical protein
VLEVLRQLARRLLAQEAGVGVAVQGEVFGDAALHQVGLVLLRRGCCAGRFARRRLALVAGWPGTTTER